MHTLRSVYLNHYTQLIKPPYTSNPFPAIVPSDAPSPALASGNRETRVLDLYITLKVREDVWIDESELHLERDECFKDLFDLMQVCSICSHFTRNYSLGHRSAASCQKSLGLD